VTSARILVVEDNPITMKLVRAALSGEGFQVLEAPDARAALEQVRGQRPALVLLDLVLPDRDGFKLLPDLRAACPDVPIVALSGYFGRSSDARASGAGFDDVLVKPVEPSRLLAVVRTWLPEKGGPVRAGAAGRRVLVVDDDPIQRKYSSVRLRSLGLEVLSAADGQEALEVARRERIDAIVSDLLMPRMDGFALCRAVRGDPGLSRLAVVLATSSYVEDADRKLAEAVGADAYVIRTPGLEQVVEALLGALSRPTRATPRGPVDAGVERDYTERVVRQLEKQVAINSNLSQRCALQAAELSILSGVTHSLTAGSGFAAGLQDVLGQCLDAGGISHGAIYLLDETGTRVVERVQVGGPGFTAAEVDAQLLADGALRLLLEQLEPVDLPAVAPPRDARLSSGMAVPITSNGERLGILVIGSHSQRLEREDWLSFARALGGQIGQALTVARAFQRVSDSERRFRSLLDSTEQGIYGLDRAGRIVFANEAAAQATGFDRAGMLGRSMHELVHHTRPDGAPYPDDACPISGVLRAGQAVRRSDEVFWRRDGRSFPVEYSANPVLADDRVDGVVVAFADISERRRQADDQRFVHLLALAVGVTETPAAALDVVLRELVVRAGATQAQAWIPNGSRLERAASVGRGLLPAATLELVPEERWLSAAAAEFRPQWVDDLRAPAAAGRSPRATELAKAGLGWVLALPVTTSGELVAILELFGDGAREEEKRLIQVAVTVATQLGPVIRERQTDEALRASEEQLRQAQKMEAVGRLAGGVAHDFNNMLTAIIGFSEVALTRLPPGVEGRKEIQEILKAGDRAAALTRQLLTFSRHKLASADLLDMNAVLRELEALLSRIIGEDIDLRVEPSPAGGSIKLDRSQLEQVVMNLVVNARDAMPKGGRITVETHDVTLEKGVAGAQGTRAAPGRYMVLVVSDTGTGMTPQTLDHLFEPFFTTKAPGKGTGLGLPTVWGIVQNAGGTIQLETALGRGTTFRVLFPRADASGEARPGPNGGGARTRRGSERVLVVEDDPAVRELVTYALEKQGYALLSAPTGAEALALVERETKEGRAIDLVVTDIVMPGMSGPELVQRLRPLLPRVVVLFVSGYTDGRLEVEGGLPPGTELLQKPFTPKDLAQRVGDLLDRA